VIGYAVGRTIDARLAVAPLEEAIRVRQPLQGGVHHSNRGFLIT
jgi:putative transposase